MSLYPLKFKPRFVEKIWGGRKLESSLGKTIPAGVQIGESWELFDFPPGVVDKSKEWVSAVVANGPLAGKTLHSIVTEFGGDLLGDVPPLAPAGQFPILIKFLDAREDLSIQVHPDDEYCREHPGSHLKSEAWYVVDHEPGARLFKGLAHGATPASFRDAINNGTVEDAVKTIPAKIGQCHYLPSGTIHALGAGILVAEVQTPSDTTFRVYDFNRIEAATGETRELHVEQALQCIDFEAPDAPEQPRSHVAGYFTTVSSLVTSPYFKIEKVRMVEGVEEPVPYDQPVVWIVLDGKAEVRVDGIKEPTAIQGGDTVLLPAAMKNPILKTLVDCTWLEVTFPSKSTESSESN